ncbi:ATP synthase subunit I [Thalassotalea ponticola]|uniref:ATP synthase subunit I n=1 Tax=Thalassotalea ponticola TaxID=1523392 RepID=UPI0025B3CE0E|nr:ATP synthase subunit I [Thalassotalea ponticola]MDN3653074.1 ATP synthase subunit I [Thalassotalea ponticola]
MSFELTKPGKKYALIQLFMQLLVTLITVITVYFNWGLPPARSALAGAVVSIIPNFVFALKAFRFAGARQAKQVVDSFYSGVKLKMVLTAVLFALCFKFIDLALLPFFVTFSLAMVAPFLTAIANKFFNFN